ncbi:ferrochelatase [Helicobacter monodelphidis]|uniref:ferrochelatase n=1 Tax=Helicobacter sp. 15-1451 TaxID=2004995 RepID=UPI000DCC670C|nr:ferrochelatase [Helicobacter sp. 15-1451]RAX58355.1 ferrochelatase [Helicobacter sp. 15-1451]
MLLNMGGPNNLDEVRTFLTNMFNDKNIISVSSSFVRSFLASLIVFMRLNKAKSNYEVLGGKSPIITHTKNLIQALQKADSSRLYTYGMSYTTPFIKQQLALLQQKNIQELVLFSLYPQYSTTTTLTSLEHVKKACFELSYMPKTFIIDRYFDNEFYNEAIAEKIIEGTKKLKKPNHNIVLIISAHGLPQSIVDKGDPYEKEVLANIETLKTILQKKGIEFKEITHAFQSRIGPNKWLTPSLKEKLKSLKGESVLIYPISFTLDNSETDFELSIEYRHEAQKIGISSYEVCECLNHSESFVKTILNLIVQKEKE